MDSRGNHPLAWTRRRWLATLGVPAWLGAQTRDGDIAPPYTVLYGHEEFTRADSMLSSYLQKQLAAFDEGRERVIAGVRTPDAAKSYQQDVRRLLDEVLGAWPERTPLHARLAGKLEAPDYRIEKVIFESRPRFYVTANVYV